MPARKLGQSQEVALTDFAPDLDPTSPGIILDASNAIPSMKGYKARNAPTQYASALPAKALGGYVALYSNNTTSTLAATAQHIYRWDGAAWVVADTTGPFAATHPWVFTQFANDVIAVNPDVLNMLVAAGPAGNFVNLGGSPPNNPVSVVSVAGFVAAYKNNQWFNTGAGVDNNWVPDIQTQAATGFLYDMPGNIVAAAAFFRTQLVWNMNAMWQLNYIAGSQVWASQPLSLGMGTFGQGCVCQLPEMVAFLGTDDFYQSQGYAPERIPNSLKEWFFVNADPVYLPIVQSWFDPDEAVVYWHFVSTAAPYAGEADRYVAWNSRTGRWSVGHLNSTYVIGNTQPGLQDGLFFDHGNILRTWNATPTTMSLLTGYMGDADSLTQVTKVRGKYSVSPTSEVWTPEHTYILGTSDTVDAPAILADDGWHNLRVTDRYHRGLLSTVGPCEITALAFEARTSGVR